MRKYIFMIFAALLITGCKNTNENLVQDRGVAVIPTMSDPVPAYFTDDIASSYVQFDLSLPQGQTVDKAEIEVDYGDQSAIVKQVSLPVTGLQVTATEVIQALNLPAGEYKTGDNFNLYVLTTKDGRTTRSTAAFSIPVVCDLVLDDFTGTCTVTQDDWWGETPYPVVVTKISDTQLSIANLFNANADGFGDAVNPLVITINPINYTVSFAKQVLVPNSGNLWWGIPSYSNFYLANGTGKIDACNLVISFTATAAVDAGSFGNMSFVLGK
jgi:hypothetical protein